MCIRDRWLSDEHGLVTCVGLNRAAGTHQDDYRHTSQQHEACFPHPSLPLRNREARHRLKDIAHFLFAFATVIAVVIIAATSATFAGRMIVSALLITLPNSLMY